MSKVVRINEEILNELNKIDLDINKAISKLLQIVTKSVTITKLSDQNFLKEIEKTLIKVANMENVLRTHTEEITQIQEKIQQLAILNKWRLY